MKARRSLFLLAGLLFILLETTWAQVSPLVEIGSSPNSVGAGARAMGMGDAFVAVADDASAASWNPAGLTALEKPEVSIVLSAFRRKDDISSGSHPEADSSSSESSFDLNYLSMAFPLAKGGFNLSFSLNYQRLLDFTKEVAFPFNQSSGSFSGTLNYRLAQEGEFTAWIPALAVDVNDNLSLGLSFLLLNNSFTAASAYSRRVSTSGVISFDMADLVPGAASQVVAVDDNLTINDEYEVKKGLGLVLGLMWRLDHRWKIGAVLKPRYDIEMKKLSSQRILQTVQGSATPLNDLSTATQSDSVLTMPTVVAVGTSLRQGDALTLSADITWTDWGGYRISEAGSEVNPVSGLADSNNSNIALRLGLEYLFFRDGYIVPLRGGIGYDPEPAAANQDDFLTLSIGTGIIQKEFSVDFATRLRLGFNTGKTAYQGIGAVSDTWQLQSVLGLVYWF
ncbi:MAG: outer membrane protein transport protein [Planctomycetes bacterium]|nr:outer membrane protein transport protein [Planctomycetota bacterium]